MMFFELKLSSNNSQTYLLKKLPLTNHGEIIGIIKHNQQDIELFEFKMDFILTKKNRLIVNSQRSMQLAAKKWEPIKKVHDE
jgi:hypothetical protein